LGGNLRVSFGQRVGLVSVTPLFDANGKCMNLIGTVHDITERKRAEHATRLLAAIVESSEDAIVSKNLNGIITTWNKGAERLFGYMAGKLWSAGHHSYSSSPYRRGARHPSTDSPWANVLSISRPSADGRTARQWIHSLTVSPIRDEQGNIIGASKLARDITARKAAERRLSQNGLRTKEAQRQLQEHAADLERRSNNEQPTH